jgi:hypothetical protein
MLFSHEKLLLKISGFVHHRKSKEMRNALWAYPRGVSLCKGGYIISARAPKLNY